MKFLVIGESCRDIFTYGHSKRLSPEAPVPIFTPSYTKESGGMAKNVYNNLKSIIEKEGSEDTIEGIFSTHEAQKIRYVDSKTNHYFLRVDAEDDKYERIKLTSEHKEIIKSADVVLVSD